MPRRLPTAIGPLAGALAGALVGLADGLRAGALLGVSARALLASGLLAGAADALLGALAGTLLEPLARLAVWGWRGRPPLAARVAAWVVAGAGAAAGTAAAVSATATRNNRFLAAGLAALAAIGLALGGALLGPALARVLGAPFRPRPATLKRTNPSALITVPLASAIVGGTVFLLLWKSRAPLFGHLRFLYAARAAGFAALGPWLVAIAVRARLRLGWAAAAVLATLLFGGPAAAALAWSWSDNLRFAPWIDIAAGAAILAAGVVLAFALARRLPRRAPVRFASAVGAVGLALALLLPVSASESARKAGAARTGLVAPLLALGRQALDFDRDGYARFLGGGDCDDGDPGIHPGAIDLPGDGIDSDCDGHDAAVAALTPAIFALVPDSVPRDLNILFLTIDTLRADHLGCYGYGRPTSPRLDALAAEGTLFENGWAHAPSTRYSMPALATGRWPSAIDWDESIWWPRMRGMRTLAEALHDAGYFTGGMFSFSYFALADHRGFERGMDYYNADRAALHVAVNGPMESHGSSSREMADDAIAFLDAHRAQKFFLWLHFYDPHLSYEPHSEVPSFGTSRPDLYDGEIRFTDLHVGRVLDHLRALGIDGRTAVVVTGDHGEGLGEHGITEHGFDLYAPQTKVPFIIRVPGLPAQRRRAPAGHVDLAPTLLNLARGKPEPSFLGRSLVEVLAGGEPDGTQQDRARAVFQEVSSERGKKRALVSASHHLLWNWIPDNTTECYDRRVDAAEDVVDAVAFGGAEVGVEVGGAVAAAAAQGDLAGGQGVFGDTVGKVGVEAVDGAGEAVTQVVRRLGWCAFEDVLFEECGDGGGGGLGVGRRETSFEGGGVVMVGQGGADVADDLGAREVDLALGEGVEGFGEASGEGEGGLDEAAGFVGAQAQAVGEFCAGGVLAVEVAERSVQAFGLGPGRRWGGEGAHVFAVMQQADEVETFGFEVGDLGADPSDALDHQVALRKHVLRGRPGLRRVLGIQWRFGFTGLR